MGLEHRQDRWQRCEAMLRKELPWLTFDRFSASNGEIDDIPVDAVALTWNTKCNALYGDYEDIFEADGVTLVHKQKEFLDPGVIYRFSAGERGCAHSHYRIWQIVAESPVPLLLLEDDVCITFERSGNSGCLNGKLFTARLEAGMLEAERHGADVLYLGWSGWRQGNYRHHRSIRGRQSKIIRKAEYVWTTVAYVIWPRGAKKLLDAAKPINQPVDNFMAWECREGRLNAYVLLDETDSNESFSGGIACQVNFMGDSDVKKSDGGIQDDDPLKYLVHRPVPNSDTAV